MCLLSVFPNSLQCVPVEMDLAREEGDNMNILRTSDNGAMNSDAVYNEVTGLPLSAFKTNIS